MRGKRGEELGSSGKRKRWSAAEKLRIVLEGLEPGVEVSDLCRRAGVNPTLYYQGKRILLGAAERKGSLQYVAQLSSGFTEQAKAMLAPMLVRRLRARQKSAPALRL